jgi:hypothetical protein
MRSDKPRHRGGRPPRWHLRRPTERRPVQRSDARCERAASTPAADVAVAKATASRRHGVNLAKTPSSPRSEGCPRRDSRGRVARLSRSARAALGEAPGLVAEDLGRGLPGQPGSGKHPRCRDKPDMWGRYCSRTQSGRIPRLERDCRRGRSARAVRAPAGDRNHMAISPLSRVMLRPPGGATCGARSAARRPLGPHEPGRYGCTEGGAARSGAETSHSRSIPSARVNRVRSPMSASWIRRS